MEKARMIVVAGLVLAIAGTTLTFGKNRKRPDITEKDCACFRETESTFIHQEVAGENWLSACADRCDR
jgi:hypothetical protein